MSTAPVVIETAIQRLGVRTPDEYREYQQNNIDYNKRRRPSMSWRDPHPYAGEPLVAYIGAGAWRVKCECGEAPPTHPEWKIACCSGCGLRYKNIVFPSELEMIEKIMLMRPKQITRNWLHTETVEQAAIDNINNGDKFPDELIDRVKQVQGER